VLSYGRPVEKGFFSTGLFFATGKKHPGLSRAEHTQQAILLTIRARKLCPKNQFSRAERHLAPPGVMEARATLKGRSFPAC
jgi:hypothetical protein